MASNSELYINTFKSAAGSLARNGIYFNKEAAQDARFMEFCFSTAKNMLPDDSEIIPPNIMEARAYIKEVLGNDTRFLENRLSIRKYVKDVFGGDISYLLNEDGDVMFDLEHMLLLYYKYEAAGETKLSIIALALVYYVAAEQITRELFEITRTSNRGIIKPNFDLNPQTFEWRRCNLIFRKYMLYYTLPQGYKGYYFERPNIAQLAFLCATGKQLKVAEDELRNIEGGLLYPFLPKNTENLLLPEILSGEFTKMQGRYAQFVEQENLRIASECGGSDYFHFYNLNVKPIMIELNGMIMDSLLKERNANPDLSIADAYIYHVSPFRFGLCIRDDMRLEQVVPSFASFMKPVVKPDIRSMILGLYL